MHQSRSQRSKPRGLLQPQDSPPNSLACPMAAAARGPGSLLRHSPVRPDHAAGEGPSRGQAARAPVTRRSTWQTCQRVRLCGGQGSASGVKVPARRQLLQVGRRWDGQPRGRRDMTGGSRAGAAARICDRRGAHGPGGACRGRGRARRVQIPSGADLLPESRLWVTSAPDPPPGAPCGPEGYRRTTHTRMDGAVANFPTKCLFCKRTRLSPTAFLLAARALLPFSPVSTAREPVLSAPLRSKHPRVLLCPRRLHVCVNCVFLLVVCPSSV